MGQFFIAQNCFMHCKTSYILGFFTREMPVKPLESL